MRYYLIIFFLILFSICVSAQEINFLKEPYSSGETVQIGMVFPFLPLEDLSVNDFFIYDDQGNAVNIGLTIVKISEDHYFVYFDLHLEIKEGNYTFLIKDVLYRENEILKRDSFSESFSVIKKIRPRIVIKPAVIKFDLGKQKPFFKIRLTNHEESAVLINLESPADFIQPSTPELLIPGKSTKYTYVHIDANRIESNTVADLVVNYTDFYKIPFFIFLAEGVTLKEIEVGEKPMRFFVKSGDEIIYLDYLYREIQKRSFLEGQLYLENLLNYTLTNITFSLSGNLDEIVDIGLVSADKLEQGEVIEQNILVNEQRDPQLSFYEGDLILKSLEATVKFPISIALLEEKVSVKEEPKVEEPLFEEEKVVELPIEEKEERKFSFKSLIVILILFLIIGVIILLRKRKGIKAEKFSEYVSRIAKR